MDFVPPLPRERRRRHKLSGTPACRQSARRTCFWSRGGLVFRLCLVSLEVAALFVGQSGSSEYSPNGLTCVAKSGLRQNHLCVCRSIRTHVSRMRPTFCRLSLLALFFSGLPGAQGGASPDAGGVPQARINPDPVRVNVIEGDDVRFLRLSGFEGLSQNRVTQIVQDDQGFIWLATQHGVDRYDGYQFRMFRNDPHQANSLCGVFMLSLFKDRSGTLWMGCEHGLDRFDPSTETFVHYPISSDTVPHLSDVVRHIYEDAGGILWLSTGHGLCRLDPRSRKTTWYRHSAGDRLSLSSDDIKSRGEAQHGVFWVATGEGLDAFDLNTSHVTLHVPPG